MSDEEIRQLVLDGWRSVSRRYCTIARLPNGLDGRQALAVHDPEMANRTVDRRPERFVHSVEDCAGYYMRVHARADGLWRDLSTNEFRRFRKMGGEAAR